MGSQLTTAAYVPSMKKGSGLNSCCTLDAYPGVDHLELHGGLEALRGSGAEGSRGRGHGARLRQVCLPAECNCLLVVYGK